MSNGTTRTCPGCGVAFGRKPGPGRWPRGCPTCAPDLRREANRLAARHRPYVPKQPRPSLALTCIGCGADFLTRAFGNHPKACPSCSELRRKRLSAKAAIRRADAVRLLKSCDVCWGPIPPGRSKRCSLECAKEAQRHHRLGWPVNASRLVVRSCGCGAAFIARRATGPGQRKCDTCSVSEADRLRARRAARAAAVRAGEVVRLADVAERDHFQCQICESDVDMAIAHPHPLSPSLDHIVPLAKGGAHTMVNSQLAHLRCNMVKSDHLVDEPRLLG